MLIKTFEIFQELFPLFLLLAVIWEEKTKFKELQYFVYIFGTRLDYQ